MKIYWLTLLSLISFASGFSQTDTEKLVLPDARQVEWANAEIGVIIHFDLVTFRPDYDFRKWGTHPPASVFNPSSLNTDQWIRAAKAAGATYAVLVAKHGTGFSLWPTKAHDYSVRNSPWENGKGDVVRDFIASCKKYGIRPGIYASASANGYLYVDNPGLVQPGGPVTQQQYNRIVEQQLTELWTNYGHLFEIWFDGGVLPVSKGGPMLAPLLKKLQPDAIVFQGPVGTKNLVRWVGNEDGVASYPDWSTDDTTTSATGTVKMDNLGGDPHGKAWVPGEADFPIRDGWQGGWFWKAHGQHLKTVEQLLQKYRTSVGRNANMLIGMVIDTTGRVPDEDVARYTAFGKALKEEFSHPVYTGAGEGALINIDLGPKPRELNCVVLSEDIAKGERVRSYVIEALIGDRWQTIARGTSIGHKHIEDIPTVTASRLRIRVTRSVGKPRFRKIAVYNISPEYANNQR